MIDIRVCPHAARIGTGIAGKSTFVILHSRHVDHFGSRDETEQAKLHADQFFFDDDAAAFADAVLRIRDSFIDGSQMFAAAFHTFAAPEAIVLHHTISAEFFDEGSDRFLIGGYEYLVPRRSVDTVFGE